MRHLNHLARGFGALILILVFVVGVPVGLVAYVGWPLPTTLPTLDEIQLGLRSGINSQVLINTLAVIVWFTWIQLVITLAAEAVAAIRGRTTRRLPVLPGLQPAVAQLVAAITLTVAALGPLRVAPAAATPFQTQVVGAAYPALELDNQPGDASKPDAVPARGDSVETVGPSYLVGRHDTFWQIAETTLGDGRRWQEIRGKNIGRIMADGQRITETTDRLTPGWLLILPFGAQVPEEPDNTQDQTLTEITVERGDNFWVIAERTLADTWRRPPTTTETVSYWRQVIDVNLDRLRPPHDPSLIYPGQVFRLPPVPKDPGTGSTEHGTDEDAAATTEITVEQGDNFWVIAERTLADTWRRPPTTTETVSYWRQVIDVNLDRLRPPHDPSLIYPGQVFQLPPVPEDLTMSVSEENTDGDEPSDGPHTADQPVEPPTKPNVARVGDPVETPTPHDQTQSIPALPVTPPAEPPPPTETQEETIVPSETDPGASQPGETDDQEEQQDGLLPTAAPLAGLGLLAAGIIALVGRLRRSQLRQRKPDTVPTPPSHATKKTEARLRAAAAPTATELIDLALRALAHQITDHHTPPPQVVGVHLNSDILRLLLWSAHHDPPPGWTVDDDGHSWTLPTSIDLTHLYLLADSTPAPYPALVTVGHLNDSQLLLDLEHLGAVQIIGDPSQVTATCHTMATELAASPIADTLQVVCVGFGEDLQHLERITVVDDLTDILPAVEAKEAATANQNVTPFEGRLAPWGGDSWSPMIIFDPSERRPGGGDRLLEAAHRGRAVCAVVGYSTGGQWRLHLSGDTIRIHPLGYTYQRRNLTPTEQADVADLTHTAKSLDGIPQAVTTGPSAPLVAADPNEDTIDDDTARESDSDSKSSSPAGGPVLEVRTLGIVGIVGIEGSTGGLPQPKILELVTYLAFHRNGVEADTLMEALWPEQPPNNHRLNNAMHRARSFLGTDPNGELYLPHVTDRIYRINPNIGCDLDRLTRHIRSADQSGEADAAVHLQAGLELVEGPPFSGIKDGYGWAHTEGILTHAIVTIDNTAHRLAQLALHADKPEQATWAARKGLTASWACEECYRNLMRAAITQDDQTALDAIYNELAALVDADQGPDATSWLDPETVQLYEQHSRTWRRNAR